jgi:uncharacterized protein (TIGR00725 family)
MTVKIRDGRPWLAGGGSPDRGLGLSAAFFGGCVPGAPGESRLAYDLGALVAKSGFELRHGGYVGLMEEAARGAADNGGQVVAVSVADMPWGQFNRYVTDSVLLGTMGERLDTFLEKADIVVAMGGGIGTLHEMSAAIWYAGNIRALPVVIAGRTARRLVTFLRAEKWIYESPTRPVGFLHEVIGASEFSAHLQGVRAARGEAL